MAETTATTEVAHGEAGHHGPELLGLGAEGWVYVSVTLFFLIAIFVFKAHRKIADALDAQIAETRRTLDEALAIRTEAEAVLAEAKKSRTTADKDAKAILAQAEKDASDLLVAADADAKQLIARRAKSAEEKIAAAERAAIADVRAKAATGAAAAAASLIAANHNAKADAALIDSTISQLN
jgi:F-type H+-transporting ATPase subunit b